MIVADASVLMHAIVQSPFSMEVDQSWTVDPYWIAPALWRSELRSGLTKHVRHGSFPSRDAFERALEAENLISETIEIRDHHLVLTIALESGCSAYDSEYIALAMEKGLPLLTYDRKLIDLFPGIAIMPGDWLKQNED